MKVILDTNILVAGLKSNQGASYQILSMLPDKQFIPLISVPLMLEYEAVLKREHLSLNEDNVNAVLNTIAHVSQHIKLYYFWRPLLKDPDDDMVLELAISGNANFIITFNTKDFMPTVKKFNIKLITPSTFLKLIKEKKQ